MQGGTLFSLLLFFLLQPVYPQGVSIKSLEIPIRYNEYPFYILPAEEKGILLYRKKYEENVDPYSHFEFNFYDQNLELRWTSLLELEYSFEVIEHAYSKGFLYVVFAGEKKVKNRLMIHRINLETRETETFEIETFFPEVVSYFDIFGNTMVLGGREKSKPSIVFYPLENKRPVILQGFYDKNILINDIQIDEKNELFTVLTGYPGKNNKGFLKIRSYDESGQPVENIRIDPGNDLVYVHAKSIIAHHQYRLVTGIYKLDKSIHATGIFLAALHLDGTREIRYHPFTSIMEKSDSLEKNGSMEWSGESAQEKFDPDQYQWRITELSEFGKENVMILESFSMGKGSGTFMDKTDIYHFQKALMIAFNDELKIQGMNQFNLNPIQSDRLNPNLRVKYYADSLRLTLLDENRIIRKVIYRNYRNQPLTYFALAPLTGRGPGETGRDSAVLLLRDWYDDFSLLLQLETVENREEQYKLIVTKLFDP